MGTFLALLGVIAIIAGAFQLIISILKKKAKRNSMIVLLAGLVILVIGGAISGGTNSKSDTKAISSSSSHKVTKSKSSSSTTKVSESTSKSSSNTISLSSSSSSVSSSSSTIVQKPAVSSVVYQQISVTDLLAKLNNGTAKDGETYAFSGSVGGKIQSNDSSAKYPYTVLIDNESMTDELPVDLQMSHYYDVPWYTGETVNFKVRVYSDPNLVGLGVVAQSESK